MVRSGGAILVRKDRSDIATFADLAGKRIAAADPNDFFGYQVQLNMLDSRGLNIHRLSSQVIFTHSRLDVLKEVYSGRADVGFIEAGRLEEAEKERDIPVNALKSVEPITDHVLAGGRVFPFEVSTQLYPNWPFVMHISVDFDVQALVVGALLDINSSSVMAAAGRYTGWRPSVNYLEVLQTMKLAGLYDDETEQCENIATVRDSIICPDQYAPKTMASLASSCAAAGLVCPVPTSVNSSYTCICSACVPACAENQIETEPGVCKCNRGFIDMAGKCMPMYVLILIIVFPVIIGLYVLVRTLLKWQQKRSDQLWHIKPHELEFDDPAICLGAGSFGVVLQAEYRGSIVALKSILMRGQRLSTTVSKMTNTRTRFGGLLGRSTAKASASRGGKHRGLFASGFGYIEDRYERGLSNLKRALAQATEASRKKVDEQPGTENHTSRAKTPGSAVASGRPGRHASGGSRSSRTRSLSTFFKTRAQRERDDFIQEMRLLSKLRHPCVATVIGAVLEPNCPPILVMEHMDLGSLHSLLHNPNIDVDDETTRMMMLDIVHGCRFLHAFEPPVIHGDLKSMVRLLGAGRPVQWPYSVEAKPALFDVASDWLPCVPSRLITISSITRPALTFFSASSFSTECPC
jgi:hypothetical protein